MLSCEQIIRKEAPFATAALHTGLQISGAFFAVLELADDPVWCCRNASIDPFYKTREGVFPAPGIDDVALFQHVMSIGEVHADLKILLDKQDSNAAPPDRRDHALDDPK